MHIDISHLAIYVGQVSIKDWIDVLSALLTPIVAIIAVYIAYRQWKTAEAKRRQDLFEMRYDNLYKEIIGIHNKMMQLDYTSQHLRADLIELRLEFLNHYDKYKFLLSKKDEKIIWDAAELWATTINTYDKNMNSGLDPDINEYKQEQEKCLNTIKDTLELYLRIEQDNKNLWELISSAIERLLLFLIPKTIIKRLYKKL